MKWLVLTVGGSPVPNVQSIEAHKPDRVVFLCSGATESTRQASAVMVQGKGNVCRSSTTPPNAPADLPSIPVQAKLEPRKWKLSVFNIDADNLDDCYSKSFDAIAQIRKADPKAEILADYTGGTKSMSAGLTAAALDDGHVRLVLVTGSRKGLEKVQMGITVTAPIGEIVQRRAFNRARAYLAMRDYAAAALELSHVEQASEKTAALVHRYTVCQAFDAWDRFEHATAFDLLDAGDTQGVYGSYKATLKSIVTALRLTEEDHITPLPVWKTNAGYLLASDILANGQRRAGRGQFDDAIGRNYRACELVAQTGLWTMFKVDAGRVSPDQVPKSVGWRDSLAVEPALGFLHSWELLAALEPSMGKLWSEWEGPVRHAMERRNYSLLAHGTRPVSKTDYDEDMRTGMGGFAEAALGLLAKKRKFNAGLRALDFPTDFLDQ
ncbi:MAG: TIGR02710 family CRISPR-associated CARF protein [Candidatus Cryosericum sp.]